MASSGLQTSRGRPRSIASDPTVPPLLAELSGQDERSAGLERRARTKHPRWSGQEHAGLPPAPLARPGPWSHAVQTPPGRRSLDFTPTHSSREGGRRGWSSKAQGRRAAPTTYPASPPAASGPFPGGSGCSQGSWPEAGGHRAPMPPCHHSHQDALDTLRWDSGQLRTVSGLVRAEMRTPARPPHGARGLPSPGELAGASRGESREVSV